MPMLAPAVLAPIILGAVSTAAGVAGTVYNATRSQPKPPSPGMFGPGGGGAGIGPLQASPGSPLSPTVPQGGMLGPNPQLQPNVQLPSF